jgi:uncharacterized phiE125 gp8 family phage protein
MIFELDPGAMAAGYGEAVLSLADAKAHLNVIEDHDDTLIAALRDAAVDFVERRSSLFLRPRTGVIWHGAGFGPMMKLGRGPVTAVTAVSYRDRAGATVNLVADDWRVGPGGRLLPAYGKAWPSDVGGGVMVTFSAGFTSVATEAPALISAVRMMLAHLYDNREAVVTGTITSEVPMGVAQMISLYRSPVI